MNYRVPLWAPPFVSPDAGVPVLRVEWYGTPVAERRGAIAAVPEALPAHRPRWRVAVDAVAAVLATVIVASFVIGSLRSDATSPGSPAGDAVVPAGPLARGQESGPRPNRACERPTLIGTAIVDKIVVRRRPSPGASVLRTFPGTNEFGQPRVFDLVGEPRSAGGARWFRALLPMRPNGTTGFIRGTSLRLRHTTYSLRLDRKRFRLTLYDGCDRKRVLPVGIGTGSTPTPVGTFYLAALLKPPDPTTIYGTYAYGLSAYSETLTSWRLGGIIGLHGTNVDSSIGHESSHGCIRMHNRDIERLVPLLPLGTPIRIT